MRDGFESAKKKMDAQIERDIRKDIGGDEQKIDSKNTAHSQTTFKHILLPEWH